MRVQDVHSGVLGRQKLKRSTSAKTPLIERPSSPLSWSSTWNSIKEYVLPCTLRLQLIAIIAVACTVLRKIPSLASPYALKLAVDTLAENNKYGSSNIPVGALVLFVLARICSNLLSAIQDYCYAIVSSDSRTRFSTAMFRHAQRLSLDFHLKKSTGELTSIMDRGVLSVDNVANVLVFTLFPT